MAAPKRKKTHMRKNIKYKKTHNILLNNNLNLKKYRWNNLNYKISQHSYKNI